MSEWNSQSVSQSVSRNNKSNGVHHPSAKTAERYITLHVLSIGCVKLTVKTQLAPPNTMDWNSVGFFLLTVPVDMMVSNNNALSNRRRNEKKKKECVIGIFLNGLTTQ